MGSNIHKYIMHPPFLSDVSGTPTQYPQALSFSRGHAWATQLSSIKRPKTTWNMLNARIGWVCHILGYHWKWHTVVKLHEITIFYMYIHISENHWKSTFIHRCLSAVPFGSETQECLRVKSDSFLIQTHECPVKFHNMGLGHFNHFLEKMIIHWLGPTFRSPACVAPLLLVRTCQRETSQGSPDNSAADSKKIRKVEK